MGQDNAKQNIKAVNWLTFTLGDPPKAFSTSPFKKVAEALEALSDLCGETPTPRSPPPHPAPPNAGMAQSA